MKAFGDLLRDVNLVAFCLLALACMYRWHKRSDASIRWATAAFGSMAAVSIVGAVLRTVPTTDLVVWFIKIILVVLALFPYCLYRFATAFQRPPRLLTLTAHALTAAVVVTSLAIPYLPVRGMPEPTWWLAYRIGILTQWTILFSIVAARLWVAARHEAAVVRRRMRTLALAATGLNAVVLLSGVGASARTEPMVVVTQGLSLASAVLFFVGIAPPAWLVLLWRRPAQLAFQGAMGAMFRAEKQAELTAILLPRAVGLVGARGAALLAPSGEVLASHGSVDDEQLRTAQSRTSQGLPPPDEVQRVELRAGTLFLFTSPYAPFFGPDEFAMTESLGVFADIVMDRCALADQQSRAEATLTHQATHDNLTGLPNRVLLEDRVSQALARARRSDTRVAVLFLDVDRFKVINDSLGHAVGDQLLTALAHRLQAILRPDDTIARFGGDEFVIVTESWAGDDEPTELAGRVAAALTAPVRIEGVDVTTTLSIGVAVAGADYDAGSLLRDADAAMYQAKEQGRNRCVLFDSAMREAANQRLATESALRGALERDELRVHYQPLVELASGRVTGVEALVRWQKDEDTVVLPKDFIPVAEETGLIIQVGATVLTEACRQVAAWSTEMPGLGPLSLAVNLSARELLNPGIADRVRDALATTGLDPSLLCLEITESVLLDDTESCARSFRALNALGVRIAVDDFGTGYSSLTYLKRLAVDTLKIDQTFVAGLGAEQATSGDRAIVAGIVDLAHAFGLTTVAEGVETAEQVTQLVALGCGQAQGYHFCRPLPAAEAAEWMWARREQAPSTVDEAGADHPDLLRVLLVDDQGSMRNLLRWTLEDDRRLRIVAEAPDGREAVAMARHHQPDLVLLDLAMPGVGGLEALPLIQAVAPNAVVVVVSGLDPEDVADRVRAKGAAGYLCKGTDPTRFVEDLRRLLSSTGADLQPAGYPPS